VRIHPTALVEAGVVIGAGTSVWDNVHVRGPARIGSNCIIGEKTYIAYDVAIGDAVKINAMVYIPTAVTIEDRVMVSAGVIFTNDRYPRAFDDTGGLADSTPNAETLPTIVREGATIGAGTRIGPGLEIGRYAMVGMGSVVVDDVPPYGLVYGHPARLQGYACRCGTPLWRLRSGTPPPELACTRCGRRFRYDTTIVEREDAHHCVTAAAPQ
jgi:acetyltransferase-like isoleucine patch superfamily enzyme